MTAQVEDRELQVLLEEYRMISAELLLYLKEMIKCFVFGAILFGIHFGIGTGVVDDSSTFLTKIKQYTPYGLPILGMYFAILSYIRITLSTYRGKLEEQINDVAKGKTIAQGEELMQFDAFAQIVQSFGFIKGKHWYTCIPTPMPFFAIILFFTGLAVFGGGSLELENAIFVTAMFACGFFLIYVFFVYHPMARRVLHRQFREVLSAEEV